MDPAAAKASRDQKTKEAYERLAKRVHEEHKSLLARRHIIEKKKEMLEIREKHRIEREELLKVEKAKAQRELELAHLRQLEENRMNDAKEQQRKSLLEQQKSTIMESIKKNKSLESDVVEELAQKIEDDTIDPRSLLGAQVRIMNERQADLRTKMDGLAQRLDHVERARRRAELPKLEAAIKEEQDTYENSMKVFRDEQLVKHRELWDAAKAEKDRLAAPLAAKTAYDEEVTAKRLAAYNAAKVEQEGRLNPIREKFAIKRKADIVRLKADHEKAVAALKKKAAEDKDKAEKAKTSTGIDFVPPPSRFAKAAPTTVSSSSASASGGSRWGDSPSAAADPDTREVYRPNRGTAAPSERPNRAAAAPAERRDAPQGRERERSPERDQDRSWARDRPTSRDRDDREAGTSVYRPNRDRDAPSSSSGASGGVYRPPNRGGDAPARGGGGSSWGGDRGGGGDRDRDRDRDR